MSKIIKLPKTEKLLRELEAAPLKCSAAEARQALQEFDAAWPAPAINEEIGREVVMRLEQLADGWRESSIFIFNRMQETGQPAAEIADEWIDDQQISKSVAMIIDSVICKLREDLANV